jgi:preprotein translocase subunit Sec61beta
MQAASGETAGFPRKRQGFPNGGGLVRAFFEREEGHSDAATGVVVLVVAVVLLFLLLYAGVFRGGNQPGLDINIRPGS